VDTPKPDTNISDVSPDGGLPAETLEGQLAAIAAERDQLAAEKAELATACCAPAPSSTMRGAAPSASAPTSCSLPPWTW
jgi:hypothetical protein